MTTTPDVPTPSDDGDDSPFGAEASEGGLGAEISMTEGEGNTFEPEEDPDATG